MNEHKVEELHFLDGSVYISPNKMDRDPNKIIKDGLREENKSPVYLKLRDGLFSHKAVIFSDVSKDEANQKAQTLVDFYKIKGREVLNEKVMA